VDLRKSVFCTCVCVLFLCLCFHLSLYPIHIVVNDDCGDDRKGKRPWDAHTHKRMDACTNIRAHNYKHIHTHKHLQSAVMTYASSASPRTLRCVRERERGLEGGDGGAGRRD
jgi:hypothetical protein